ncbi:MAG: phospholipid carrier-dependent glycosyltransferase [Candidatus Hydrogenedentota bacterium]|nr:MAG: phospholipid carrier-dependent glycosyltransferase [Candidatus Hydrogenedentota bacterium]
MKKFPYFLLSLILLSAAFFRLSGIGWGLPNAEHHWSYRVDESTFLLMLGEMDPAHGDFVAESIGPKVGAGLTYMIGALLLTAKTFGYVQFANSTDFFIEHPEMLTRIYLLSRLLVALMGIGSVFIVFDLGRRLFDKKTALAAAALLAVWPGHVQNSHFILADVPGGFLALVAYAAGSRALASSSRFPLFLSVLFSAAAVATKLSTALIVFPLIFLPFFGRMNRPYQKAVLWGTSFFLFLFLFHPALWNFSAVSSDTGTVSRNVLRFGRDPFRAINLGIYWNTGLLGSLALLLGLFRIIRRRCASDILLFLSLAPLTLFLVFSGQDRGQLYSPLCGFGSLLIAGLLHKPRSWRCLRFLLVCLVFLEMALGSAAWTKELNRAPIHEVARREIEATVPSGESIGFIQWFFIPHLDTRRYQMVRLTSPLRTPLARCDWVIVADYDIDFLSKALQSDFTLERIWKRTPSFLGFSYDPPNGADQRFPFPTLFLFRRQTEETTPAAP